MDETYKKLLPDWTKKLETTQYNLMGSNDSDSTISAAAINKKYGYKMKYFYDFNHLWESKNLKKSNESNPKLGVDIALTEGACIDNHVQQISYADEIINTEALNLNNIEGIYGSGNNYFRKYNLNTVLLTMSVLNIPLPEDTETAAILLAIDSAFKGAYSSHINDRQANQKYLEILGYPELIKLLNNKDEQYFYSIIDEYNLNAKIYIENGKLKSNKDLSELYLRLNIFMDLNVNLPEDEFAIIETFGKQSGNIPKGRFISKQEATDRKFRLFSLAMTGCYHLNCSYYLQ